MEQPVWSPEEPDVADANTARVRDYWLGGSHHGAPDRALAEEFIVCAPHLPYLVRIQREFLRRAVGYLVDTGIRQFLDLGSGLPTVGNVHEIAQELAPDATVVYVDVDPVVAEEGRHLLAGTPGADFIQGDFRQPDRILEASKLLDLDQPVAVLLVDVLHFVRDDAEPVRAVRTYLDHMASGSHLAMTHTSKDEGLLSAISLFTTMYGPPPDLTFREPEQIATFYAGMDVVDPGLVPIPLWRPEDGALTEHRYPEEFRGYAVVARKG